MHHAQIRIFLYISCFVIVLILAFVAVPLVNYPVAQDNFIVRQLIAESVINTVMIGGGVVLLATLFALPISIVHTYYDYRFKKLLHVLTILPLSIPAYIHAYNYSVMLGYGGSLGFLGIAVQNVYGAIVIYSLCLYPYLYMILTSTLKNVPYNVIESGRLMDRNFLLTAWRVVLPILRRAWMVGSILILAEVYSDIGVVDYFNIDTIATTIKRSYTVLGDYRSGLNLGVGFGIVMIALFLLEKKVGAKMKFSNTKQMAIRPLRMTGGSAAVLGLSMTVVAVAFVIPLVQMLVWSRNAITFFRWDEFLTNTGNTLMVTLLAIGGILVTAIIVIHTIRYTRRLRFMSTVLNIGYILPSIIISMLVTFFVTWLSSRGMGHGLYLSIVPLVFAYTVKYFSVGVNTIDKGYNLIHSSMTESSLTMGFKALATFIRVDLPLLRKSITTAAILIFIDIMKEFTLGYTLKPFNFQTLATRVAVYAQDEMVQESAIHSLTITLICVVLILILEKGAKRRDSAQ